MRAWTEGWASLGLAPPAGALEALRARYAEPHRAYHTLQHLEECFAHLEAARAEAARPAEILLALWYHDAVYDTRAHDNEARSADLASAALVQAGGPADVADRIHALILATDHRCAVDDAPERADARLIVDIDLAILGAPRDRFAEYERQVREEYAWVPEPVYRQGRGAVLQQFLARPVIYRTPAFHLRFEASARANLAASLDALTA